MDIFGGGNITLNINGQQVILSSQSEQTGPIDVTCEANGTMADDGLHCGKCDFGGSLGYLW